jgi:hypothetical protein
MLLGPTTAAVARAPVIVAAGDIACGGDPCRSHRRTAALIAAIDPRAVLTLGDNQYPDGALRDFRSSYDPTWGRFKGKTFPSPGNHEYHTPGARGYFDYFGSRAHRGTGGWYAFDLGRWQLLSINTGNRAPNDFRLHWVRRILARDGHRCELAYWHQPRFSSGHEHGSDPRMADLWRVLYRAGVDVVLNGHEHNYERFALLDPSGRRSRRGIREFVVGTGGAGLYALGAGIRGSQRRIDDRHGILRLTLHRSGYQWRFIAVGRTTLDRGRQRCHA